MPAFVPKGEYVHFEKQGRGVFILEPSDYTKNQGHHSDHVLIHKDGRSFTEAYMRAVGDQGRGIRDRTTTSVSLDKEGERRGGRGRQSRWECWEGSRVSQLAF